MAMSGTYVAEVPLRASPKNNYKKWKSENYLFPNAIDHRIQNVKVHEGDWDSQGAIQSWNYTRDGKHETLKEKKEFDDEKMTVTAIGLDGHAMDQLKVYVVSFQFIPNSTEGCVCKVTMIWEKRYQDSPEPINYLKFVKSLAVDIDDHILKGHNKA